MKDDVANIGGVSDDGENDIGLGGDGVGGISEVSSHVEEWLSFGDGAVEDGDCVAGFE